MAILEALIGPIASIIDKVIPDKAQRDKAKLELLSDEGEAGLARLIAQYPRQIEAAAQKKDLRRLLDLHNEMCYARQWPMKLENSS